MKNIFCFLLLAVNSNILCLSRALRTPVQGRSIARKTPAFPQNERL